MNKDQFTNKILRLEVSESHTLYVHDWGNLSADTPIIFLHGGPGGRVKDSSKSIFDPAKQRVIFFDQRGCGQSLPYGSLKDNTTKDLIDDITKIADELKIDRFILQGRSWGSCLALAYGIDNPDRVAGMVLGGIFTGSSTEINWIKQGMFATFYPEVWQAYVESTPKAHQKEPSNYHFNKALHGTPKEQKQSVHTYQTLLTKIVGLNDRLTPPAFEDYDPTSLQIEIHYMENNCFMPDNFILDNAQKLSMPIVIIQGRYDMMCPPKAAFELHNKLPNSELYTTLSGHISEHEDVQLIRQALANIETK